LLEAAQLQAESAVALGLLGLELAFDSRQQSVGRAVAGADTPPAVSRACAVREAFGGRSAQVVGGN
jgi:hypothetical protein